MPKSPKLRRSPRKHDEKSPKKARPGRKRGAQEPDLPKIQWKKEDGKLIWELLTEMEKKDNRLVLFGKDPDDKNTSGDNKIAVYKRIGQEILPEFYNIAPNSLAKRIKSKVEDLLADYKLHAKKLQVTGGGLQNDDSDEHEYLECYIPGDGPDHDTTQQARNIWESITRKFPFFPRMHKFLAARSNMVPPMVTTGVGPEGRKVLHLQPPTKASDPNIDPQLQQTPRHDLPDPATSPIDLTSSPLAPVAARVRTGSVKTESSSTLSKAVSKVRALRPNVGKSTFEDNILGLQTNYIKESNRRADARLELDRERLLHDQRAQLLQMHVANLLTAEAVRERLDILEANHKARARPDPSSPSSSPVAVAGPSKKHCRTRSDSSSSDFETNGPFKGSNSALGSR